MFEKIRSEFLIGKVLVKQNKKIREDNTRVIADKLQEASRSYSMINAKKIFME